jgi:NTP pyrophosphatase (non-canonical NTP hydrolase)
LEASELLECFQWSADDLTVEKKRAAMEEELADILIYAISFADAIGSDIPAIIRNKLEKNGSKYTVNRSWGNATKYTDFEEEP